MKYLVDTNILLRLVQKNSSMHLDTQRAILTLKKQGDFLCIIPLRISSPTSFLISRKVTK